MEYAPNTTGIPYFKKSQDGKEHDCSMGIIKQLYDIARLFEEVPNLDITSKSFGRIAEVELSYRGLENNPRLIFDNVRQTSLCLVTRGAEGKGNFQILQRSISRIKSFMFRGNYLIDGAIVKKNGTDGHGSTGTTTGIWGFPHPTLGNRSLQIGIIFLRPHRIALPLHCDSVIDASRFASRRN